MGHHLVSKDMHWLMMFWASTCSAIFWKNMSPEVEHVSVQGCNVAQFGIFFADDFLS